MSFGILRFVVNVTVLENMMTAAVILTDDSYDSYGISKVGDATEFRRSGTPPNCIGEYVGRERIEERGYGSFASVGFLAEFFGGDAATDICGTDFIFVRPHPPATDPGLMCLGRLTPRFGRPVPAAGFSLARLITRADKPADAPSADTGFVWLVAPAAGFGLTRLITRADRPADASAASPPFLGFGLSVRNTRADRPADAPSVSMDFFVVRMAVLKPAYALPSRHHYP